MCNIRHIFFESIMRPLSGKNQHIMKRFSNLPHLVLSLLTLTLTYSCKNDGCNDPIAFNYDPEGTSEETCLYEPKEVQFSVNPVFGDETLVIDKDFTLDDGRSIKFTYYGVYLSNLSFLEKDLDDTQPWSDQDVMLLRNNEFEINASYLNKSDITEIHFDIGVDTAIYDQDPTTSDLITDDCPLAIQVPSMYWGWAGGYRFISIEGEVDTSATMDGSAMVPFAFHCGLPANLKSLSLPFNGLNDNKSIIDLSMSLDFEVLLDEVSFTSGDLIIHSGMHPTTVKIMNNSVSAFEISN